MTGSQGDKEVDVRISAFAGITWCAPCRAVVVGLLLSLSGCQGLGPATLAAGRGAYNDVIARTNSEQTLGLIVRMRYGDPFGLLAVSSVTANLRVGANAKGEAGIGTESAWQGNIVPFSAGVSIEDNPTISYTPIEGQAFLREWLAPLSLETLAPAMQAGVNLDVLLPLLVSRMNGLRTGAEASPEERAAFARATAILEELRTIGVGGWSVDTAHASRYEFILSGYSPDHTAQVDELLRLLDVSAETGAGSTITIPVTLGLRAGSSGALAIQTKSVAEIMRTAARSIEVPEEHVKAGIVAPSPVMADEAGPALRIHSSSSAPSHANVAVEHRGWWYYVDDTDLVSKRLFEDIQLLFLSRLSEATRGAQSAPVLTIPVR
jgi:hypothetical protein